MYTAMRTASSNAYFTVLHSMWVQRASNLAGGIGAITPTFLNAASSEVQTIWELMTNNTGAASFETSNPLTDGAMAMAQHMFDSAAGVADDYSNLDDIVSTMSDDIATKGPLTAITDNFAGVGNANDLVALVQENASSSTAKAAVANAYSGTMSTSTVDSAASTLVSNAASGTVANDLMGVATVTSAFARTSGTDVKQSDDPAANTLRFPNAPDAAYGRVEIVFNIKRSDNQDMADVDVEASVGVGTVKVGGGSTGTTSTDKTAADGNMQVDVIAPAEAQTVDSQTTLTVTFTKGDQVKTYKLPIVYFNAGGYEPTDVDISVGKTEGTLLIMGQSGSRYVSANTHAVSANVHGFGAAGSFAANTYKVNFYPPEGMKFWDGTKEFDNYLVAVPSTGGTPNVNMASTFTGGAPKVSASSLDIGAKGRFRAVLTDWAGSQLSPAVSASSDDTFYQVDDINRVKGIKLQIDNGSGTASDMRKVTGQTGPQPQVNLDKFTVTIQTWKTEYGNDKTYSNAWISSHTNNSVFALQNDRGNEGFVATQGGNYDVTSYINTANSVSTITHNGGSPAANLNYKGLMINGSDNKDAITLIWHYVNGSGQAETMSSDSVYFQVTP
jgi:hypothetical protein